MNVQEQTDLAIAKIASAIGEPARVRILSSLLDGHARTATELSVVAEVAPSTASAHLNRLHKEGLIKVHLQGKHRYYSLQGSEVAAALEALSVVAGRSDSLFVPNTPNELREARTCYDHMAGRIGVLFHNRLMKQGWLCEAGAGNGYELTQKGTRHLETLGIDVAAVRSLRRRFAYACIDWSERQPHLGGALAAAILKIALKKRWVAQNLDSRALNITNLGKREMFARFGIKFFS